MRNNSEKILKQYDEIFKTETNKKIKRLPLFRVFFDKFKKEFYSESEECKELREEQEKTTNKLKNTFTQEQKELFNEYINLNEKISRDIERQLFLFGYITTTELFTETKNKNEE